jgi:hypothetical protein
MSKLKIVVWQNKNQPMGDPDVEVTIPSYMAKWVPRMMKLIPKQTKEDIWGQDADFMKDFNLEEMMTDAANSGENEVMEVKSKDGYVKIFVEK